METYETKNRYQLRLLLFNDVEITYDVVIKMTPPSLLPPLKGQGTIPSLSGIPAYRYQQSLSCCIACQDVCVQKSHAAKRLISQLELNI